MATRDTRALALTDLTATGKIDMAEVFNQVKAKLGTRLGATRLGVTGGSQGGMHSWSAAAWSERKLPTARGAITHFPRILAVAPSASGLRDAAAADMVFVAHQTNNLFNSTKMSCTAVIGPGAPL